MNTVLKIFTWQGGDKTRAQTRNELDALHEAIMYVHDETVKGMNDGRGVHTLMAEISLPADIEVGEGYGKVS